MKKYLTTALVILTLASPQIFAYEVGDTVSPDIAKKLKLQTGKIGVLDFFASWCASCAKEIPDIHKFIREDKTGKCQVVGIDVDEKLEDGKAFQKKLNITFPVYDDTNQQVVGAFKPIGMPALYYVKDNKIIGKRMGAVNHIDQQIRADLKKLGVEL